MHLHYRNKVVWRKAYKSVEANTQNKTFISSDAVLHFTNVKTCNII